MKFFELGKCALYPSVRDSRTVRSVRDAISRDAKAPADPASIERGVRQLLADKVHGNPVGLWL